MVTSTPKLQHSVPRHMTDAWMDEGPRSEESKDLVPPHSSPAPSVVKFKADTSLLPLHYVLSTGATRTDGTS